MKIILTAIDRSLAEAWKRFCGNLPGVQLHEGSIFDLVACEALVSPANSFGFMDGGIDAFYTRRFGRKVQERLQQRIREKHHGELLVGQAEFVETDDPQFPYLLAAPTMRVPMKLQNTVNPYLAARAVLLLLKHGTFPEGPRAGEPISNAVSTVAFSGLGTGVGGVGPNTCARQMRAAIEEVLLGKGRFPRTWAEAQRWHQELYTDRIRDLQKG